jgi:hypothetical protein
MFAACLAFIFLLLEIHKSEQTSILLNDYRYVRLFLECMSAISLFIGIDIFAESKQIKFSTRVGLYLLGFCVLGMHYYSITPGMFDSETIFISRYLIFLSCFHLLISFLAFYHSNEIQSFWQYNYFLLKRILTSLLYSITLFAGLGSAMWALDKLFLLNIHSNYYTDLGAFIFLIFNTLFFLKGIPTNYQDFAQPIEYKKSIRVFAQYVLLPIVSIYLIILYLYLIKIVATQTIPNGWACIPVLIFSIVGILTYLLIYPIRHQQAHRAIWLFAKYFYYLLLPLLSLYFIAIIQRIMPYGITEDRYLVFMLGVWILIISVYIISSKVDNIIVIPVSLFVLLAISAVGPWGMFQLSVANQVMRLENLLTRNKLLVDGKLVDSLKAETIQTNDAASIRSIFTYLNKRGELMTIHRWLDEKDQAILDSAIAKNDMVYMDAIFPGLMTETHPSFTVQHVFTSDSHNLSNQMISVSGFTKMMQFDCHRNSPNEKPSKNLLHPQVTLLDNELHLQLSDTSLTISLQEIFSKLIDTNKINDSINALQEGYTHRLQVAQTEGKTIPMPPELMRLETEKYSILLQTVTFLQADTVIQIQGSSGFILFR